MPDLFQTITRALDGLDLIVYVAGIQPPIALNEYDFAKDADMMAVNVLGAYLFWIYLTPQTQRKIRQPRARSQGRSGTHRRTLTR